MILPPVETDESLVAHGLYQQMHQGEPTRVQEFWTVHSLPDQAHIWRSQLVYDGRVPLSACYVLRDPELRPVQVVFYWRWQDGREDMVEYRFMPGYAIILQDNLAQDMILPAWYEVNPWHTITRNFVWFGYDQAINERQSFPVLSPGIQQGTLWPGLITVSASLERVDIMPGPAGPHKGFVFSVDQPGLGAQSLLFDEFGVPLRWELPGEQLVVRLAEYVRNP